MRKYADCYNHLYGVLSQFSESLAWWLFKYSLVVVSIFQCAYMCIFFELFYYDITKYDSMLSLKHLDKWWMSNIFSAEYPPKTCSMPT